MLLALFLFSVFSGHTYAYALIDLDWGTSVGASTSADSASADNKTPLEMTADRVENVTDLDAYSNTAMQGDSSLDSMSFTENSVTVTYKAKGRLLALVPMSFLIRATAHANGKVELTYPWYSFLTLDGRDQLETEMRVAVDNALRAQALGSVRAEGEAENSTLTPAQKAILAREMNAILKASVATKGF